MFEPIEQSKIDKRIKQAKKNGYYALLVVSDTFDYSSYCVDVKDHRSFNKAMDEYNDYNRCSRVMETHKLIDTYDKTKWPKDAA